MNGYVKNAQNEMFMWIGKRSEAKQTWPGKLDNTVSYFYNCIIKIVEIEEFKNSIMWADVTVEAYHVLILELQNT